MIEQMIGLAIAILYIVRMGILDANSKGAIMGAFEWKSVPVWFKSSAQKGLVPGNYESVLILGDGLLCAVPIAFILWLYHPIAMIGFAVNVIVLYLCAGEFLAYWLSVPLLHKIFGMSLQPAHWEDVSDYGQDKDTDGIVSFGQLPDRAPWMKFAYLARITTLLIDCISGYPGKNWTAPSRIGILASLALVLIINLVIGIYA